MTVPCFVYVAKCRHGAVKVGFSKNPEQRLAGMGLKLLHVSKPTMAARKAERFAHSILSLAGYRIGGEFFKAPISDCVDAVDKAVKTTIHLADKPRDKSFSMRMRPEEMELFNAFAIKTDRSVSGAIIWLASQKLKELNEDKNE